MWDLGSLAMEVVLRELSGQLRSLNFSLLNCVYHLLFYHYFSNVLDLFLERIEKLFSPWIREQIVPHLRGVTVYFPSLPSLNLIKCCLSTDIFGISDHDLMYSHEDVETADEHSVPDREAIQARVSYPAV